MHDSIDNILKKQADAKKQQEIVIENIQEYKSALNNIFASPDGQLVLKRLIKYCGVFNLDNSANGYNLVENTGKRKVYLEFIRPYLDKTITNEVE